MLIWFSSMRIKLLTIFRMSTRPLQCSCQIQLNVQIRIFKRDHCSVYIKRNIRPWNVVWVLKLSMLSSIISGSNWENLKHIELQLNLPLLNLPSYKKDCNQFLSALKSSENIPLKSSEHHRFSQEFNGNRR